MKLDRFFHMSSSSDTLSESPSRSSVLRLYPGVSEAFCGFTSTHNPCRQRRDPLGTGYPLLHSGIMSSPNSMGARECRVTSKLLGIWGFPVNPTSLGLHNDNWYQIRRWNISRDINENYLFSLSFINNTNKSKNYLLCWNIQLNSY